MKLVLAALVAATPAFARDVTGAFQTVYWPDSGVRTTRNTPQPGVTLYAIAGGAVYPGTVHDDGSFVVPGVPDGVYFLAIDRNDGSGPTLTQLTTSTPDASTVVAYRPDLQFADGPVPVSLSVTNLEPWTPGPLRVGDLFQIDGAQSNADVRPWPNSGRPPAPARGATGESGVINWNFFFGTRPRGLPQAGDPIYFHQNPHSVVGSGPTALALRQATRWARRDDVSIVPGASNSISIELQDAPQTGRLRGDVRYTKFARLAPSVHPGATPDSFDFDIFGYPRTVRFPDAPFEAPAPVLLYFGLSWNGASLPDTDYGTLRYGQFLDASWVEMRQVLVTYDVPVTAPGAAGPSIFPGGWSITGMPETRGVARAPIAPHLRPWKAFVDGAPAFQAQSNVGLTPTLSWGSDDEHEDEDEAADDGGGMTVVTVYQLFTDPDGSTDFAPVLAATVFGSSFTVPPGFLAPGTSYFADIVRNRGEWMHLDQPLFRGGPAEAIDTVTAPFATAP